MGEEFKPIMTQEDFDSAIGSRIKRERDTVSKEFAAQIEEITKKSQGYEKQIGELGKQLETAGAKDKTIEELTSKVKGYETASVKTRIANEIGIPYELAARLSGDDEDSIRKDAETLSKFIGSKPIAPLGSSEQVIDKDPTKSALRKTLKQLKGE